MGSLWVRRSRRVVGLTAALAAVSVSGCGSAHPQPVRLEASAQPVSHVLDCVAYQVPGSVRVRSSAGTKGLHGFEAAPTVVVEWPEEVLLVREARSPNQATQWASQFGKHVDTTSTAAASSAAYGRFVVQWGPKSPSAKQGAVLLGCI